MMCKNEKQQGREELLKEMKFNKKQLVCRQAETIASLEEGLKIQKDFEKCKDERITELKRSYPSKRPN